MTPEGERAIDEILCEFDREDGILGHESWTVPVTPWWRAVLDFITLT